MSKKEQYIDFSNVQINNQIVLSIKESGKTVQAIKKGETISKVFFTTLTYIFILALALLVIFPFYWMIITSLKQLDEILSSNQTYFPNIVMWTNYVYVFRKFNFTNSRSLA